MTIGKKLMLSIGAMLLALLALAAASLYSISTLGDELNKTASQTSRKLDTFGAMATNASEMLSFERGVLVRLSMKDLPKAEGYHTSFGDRAKLILDEINEMRPMLVTEQGNKDMDVLSADLASWSPAHQELWETGRTGNLDRALSIYDKQTLPLAKEMQKATDDLKQTQRRLLAESIETGRAKVATSRWIAIFIIVAFLGIGVAVVKVVLSLSNGLRRAALELSEGSGQIKSASSQVASSSQALAQGASEQAASLEETSASTEEITSMTRKNAENSKSAADVMAEVDREVKEGNQTLDQMVLSMQQINASSDKISKIIKVIDEIAFQTNILALNAAVEAARAGEAGMGFAVVADEVRNLAQRSAQAAKDTAALIEESIATSRDGSTKLEQVAGVIRAITESSAHVKTLVDEVNMGSQEQARGIDQIAKAVAQMDQVTQTTAASAEESASASEELSAQAQALNHIVVELAELVGGDEQSVSDGARTARKYSPSPSSPAVGRSVSALKSAVSRPKPKMAPVMAGAKSGRNEFPLEDNFGEM
jgi:methyl-accepting chemotaxis protein/methyl-accepting chemotaxis protein-1 (serine sensor receptor)